MNRFSQRELVFSSFHLLMAYSTLKLFINFITSLFDFLRAIIEFFVEYKDILFT